LERARPDLVGRYLLDPSLPPPGELDALLATGKVRYADATDAIPESARILHSLSPLDPAAAVLDLWPAAAEQRHLVRSATAYDFIPALDPERELADAPERARYRVRFELLRSARQLHVLSHSVARDAWRLLGRGPRDVVVVGAAPAPWCAPASDRADARRRVQARVPSLDQRYVLYPTGSHPRKNNERLVRAWALLPAPILASYQLVLSGDLPASTAHHYAHLARSCDAGASVTTTGLVDDDLLLALYQGADLVCFASLAEGFGLPVVEAFACGTPVVASDRPPIDELVAPEHRFDPEDETSIARAIASHLPEAGGPAAGAPSGARTAARSDAIGTAPTWADVATRTASAFDALLDSSRPARSTGHGRSRRHAMAFVSPLPPSPTGIAAYSWRLVEELRATGAVEVDAFADGPTPDQRAPAGAALYRARSLPEVELVRGGYDSVVYSLGNSHHHLGALASLRRRPGTVIGHDVRFTNLYRHEHGYPGLAPGGFARAIRAMYGAALPDRLGEEGSLSDGDLDRYGVLMAREVVASSERFLVSSSGAARLAGVDVGSALAKRIGILPFAFEPPVGGAFADDRSEPPHGLAGPARAFWGASATAVPAGTPVVAHFGIVDPAKEPDTLVAALARSGDQLAGAVLAFVGPISDAFAVELASRASDAGIGRSLLLTGPLAPDAYRSWMERATVAVQLRRSSNGEASAAVGECLASGVATVVSDLGWARELPGDAVVRLPVPASADSLAAVLVDLVRDEPRRAALAAAGRAEAGRRSFASAARALLEIVESPATSGARRRDVLF